MTKTLLNGVNDVLSRSGIIAADGLLSTLDDSSKQIYIDLAIQIWNESLDEICNLMGIPHPLETASYTVTLVTAQREYDLPSDLVQLRWPLIDQTNGNYIQEYPGGYEQMRIDQQIPGDWTGLSYSAVVNPTTGDLRLERTPTSTENGKAYNMLYDRDLHLEDADDSFPFSDSVYRSMVPVVAEGWDRRKRNDFDGTEWRRGLARAVAFANQANRRKHW